MRPELLRLLAEEERRRARRLCLFFCIPALTANPARDSEDSSTPLGARCGGH